MRADSRRSGQCIDVAYAPRASALSMSRSRGSRESGHSRLQHPREMCDRPIRADVGGRSGVRDDEIRTHQSVAPDEVGVVQKIPFWVG